MRFGKILLSKMNHQDGGSEHVYLSFDAHSKDFRILTVSRDGDDVADKSLSLPDFFTHASEQAQEDVLHYIGTILES